MKDEVKYIIKMIKREIPEIAILSLIGSYKFGGSAGDIDIFLILAEEEENEDEIFRKMDVLIEILDGASEDNVLISHFNITKILSAEAYKECYKKDISQVHLLFYPTVKEFITWENPWVVKSICEDAINNLICGDRNILLRILDENRNKLSLESLYSFTLERLLNSFVFIPNPVNAVTNFEIKMVNYCLKNIERITGEAKIPNEAKEKIKKEVEEIKILNELKNSSRVEVRKNVLKLLSEVSRFI